MVSSILFYILAAILIFFSLKVVTTKNLFHSVMAAFAVLMGTAALFFLMNAEFLGVVQLLVYAGAVTILVIFVVMLTTAGTNYNITWETPPGIWSFLVITLFGGMLAFIILSIAPIAQEAAQRPEIQDVTREMSIRLFTEYILPFEVASLLILATLIGGIVLARRD